MAVRSLYLILFDFRIRFDYEVIAGVRTIRKKKYSMKEYLAFGVNEGLNFSDWISD